ncbi:hypothetical protein CYY_000341 [Polysphondylium violaceum]|uniref:CP-type G domain-containing protein n=1 Tax=Polysphondylium violaceum TaxID=133409 RepID=A0A8J4Q4W0_9MYCE|nr:hypothetical protein CYY_000341 [Polysphondylium violaceum]
MNRIISSISFIKPICKRNVTTLITNSKQLQLPSFSIKYSTTNSSNGSNNDENNVNATVIESESEKKLSSKQRNILKKMDQKTKQKQLKSQNAIDIAFEFDKKSLPRCSGCGTQLQTEKKNNLGYIPESVALRLLSKDNQTTNHHHHVDQNQKDEKDLKEYFNDFKSKFNKNDDEIQICQRCHLLKNHGKISSVNVPVENFRQQLEQLKHMNCVIIKVVDLMDFSGSFVEDFRDVVGNNPVILVANKLDLLPRDIKHQRVEEWIRTKAKEKGLLSIAHVKLLSSTNREGMQSFIIDLEKMRRGRDVFIVGCSNVGKSTFLNSLLEEYKNKVEIKREDTMLESSTPLNRKQLKDIDKMKHTQGPISKATTSVFPGTTLNLVSFPLWDNSNLFDTPGIDSPHQMIKLLNMEELKKLIPKEKVKPTVIHMSSGKTLFLGGLVRIDFEGPISTFTVYVSNKLPVHTTSLRKADDLLHNQHGKLLSPPILPESPTQQERDAHLDRFHFSQIQNFSLVPEKIDFEHTFVDLVISGVGWVSIKCISKKVTPLRLTVHTPSKIDVSIRRPPLIPKTNFFKHQNPQ